MESFNVLLRFPEKMILYSLIKFGNLKPWTNISWLKRFNLGYWPTSKQVYRKLTCKDKIFGEFQGLPCFPKKLVLYSSTKFWILKIWTNIPWLKRFDLGFSQTSKQIYRKLKYRGKLFGEFQCLPCFPKKLVLYLSTKFGILELEPIFHGSKDSS